MHVNEGKIRNLPYERGKLEISLVWGKLQIKFPVRSKETEAVMVLLIINSSVRKIYILKYTFAKMA